MAYPVGPQSGNLTCATANTDLNHLFGSTATTGCLRVHSWTFNPEADEVETTAFGASAPVTASYIAGLFAGTVDFNAMFPKIVNTPAATTPWLGHSGLITFASKADAVTFAHEADITFEFGEVDITSFTSGSAHTARAYRPFDLVRWGGSWTTRHANSPTLPQPTAVNTGGASATFKLIEDSSNDVTLAGNIIVPRGPQMTVDPRTGDIRATYQFRGDGDCTAAGGSAGTTYPPLFPAGVVNGSDWDTTIGTTNVGTPNVAVVATAATSRTYSFNGFLRSLRVQWGVGTPITVSGTLRIASAVTGA